MRKYTPYLKTILLIFLIFLFVSESQFPMVSTLKKTSLLDKSASLNNDYKEPILMTNTNNQDAIIIILKSETTDKVLVSEYSRNLFINRYRLSDNYIVDLTKVTNSTYNTVISSTLYDYAYEYNIEKNEVSIFESGKKIHSGFIFKTIIIVGSLIAYFVIKKKEQLKHN